MLNKHPLLHSTLAALIIAALPSAVHASCGSAFCTLMTDRYAQGSGEPHLGWSSDVRLEAVTQKQLRSGTSKLDASQVTGEEAIERHTKNLNLVTTLGYGFDADWSVSVRIPVVKRDHLHDLIDEQTGQASTPEQWRFTKVGDVQLLARRQFVAGDGAISYALFGGLKLPTGSTQITNGEGSRAERALQPGTGTTDVVFGIAARKAMGMADALVGQASVSQALNGREEFKPGRRIELSAGWSHAWSQNVGSVLQLNLRQRGRDSGAQSEPGNSGSTTVDLSPGVTVGVGHASTLYAYVQLPLYQKVNGIQLVPHSALALGWTSDF
ncbi:MAG: hypothetical protein ABL916_14910 [Burkholderiaceae bacterium]